MARGDLGPAVSFVRGLVRPHRQAFTLSVVGAALFAGATVLTTVVFGRIVDRVVVPTFDDGLDPSASTVLGWAALIIIVAVVRIVGVVMRRYFAGKTAEQVSLRHRRQLAMTYNRVPMGFHRRRSPGDLLAHVDADSETLAMVIHPLPFSLAVVFMGIFAALAMALVDLVLAGIALVIFPGLIAFNRIYSSRVEEPARLQQEAIGEVSTVAHESFDGALLVKLLGREEAESQRFGEAAETLRRHRVTFGDHRAAFEAALEALPNLAIIVVLIVGAGRIDAGHVTVGELVQFAALFAVLALPMRVLGFFLESVPPSQAASRRLQSVFEEPLEATTDVHSAPQSTELVIDGLTLRPGAHAIVHDVDLVVQPGETVALVGATGSGKSILVSAIAGLLEPDSGTITFGGVRLDDLDPQVRTDAIRIAFQEAFLFADSIEQNITLERSRLHDAELASALATAAAEDFVGELPHGPETVVGQRGMTLSGGQRQRVALARAVAGDPKLVVIDDAFSAVDPVIERQILDALRHRHADLSMLVIAHRLSTMRLADRIVFLVGGRVVAEGTHDELLARDDYRALATAYEQAEVEW